MINLPAATVLTALQNFNTNYLQVWAVPIAVICVTGGALVWMLSGSLGSSQHGANGLRAVMHGIVGVFIVFSALSIINIGKSLAG